MGEAGTVTIREVGPRDGLQVEAPIAPPKRAALIEAVARAGCRHIEIASFVSERAVPSMAGAAEVLSALELPAHVVAAVLVPNEKRAELALRAALRAPLSRLGQLTVTLAASPVYNEANVKLSIEGSIEEISRICALVGTSEPPIGVDAVVSCAFGSPYEGDIATSFVASLCERLLGVGVAQLTLADTTGMATPRVLAEVLAGLDACGISREMVGLHLHETRGTAMVNAYSAISEGIRRFDTSLGGLGGSPFAAGSGGNLATEDFVALLHDLGFRTGIELDGLLETAGLLRRLVGHELKSKLPTAGPRTPIRG